MKDVLNIALAAFAPENSVETSLVRLGSLVDGILSENGIARPDIIAFPETFCTGNDYSFGAAEHSEEIVSWMRETAARAGCALAGSVITEETGSLRNRFCFVEPSGLVHTYDKRHPYFGNESDAVTPGTERVVFEWKGWRIMPAVCMDLRFPCWSRNSGDCAYDLYLNVANWPVARKRAADMLLRARAIENVAYAVFCNRDGRDSLLEYDGCSWIVNHRGRDKASLTEIGGVKVYHASLDKDEMLRFRRSFPVLEMADEFYIAK